MQAHKIQFAYGFANHIAMLVDDELDQFDRLTFGEVFHWRVMFRIEVRGPSLGIGEKTTDLTPSHWNQVMFLMSNHV